MKKSKLVLNIGFVSILVEFILDAVKDRYSLPSWVTPIKWILLLIAFVCVIGYLALKNVEQ
ncbi:hypothetical protein [Qiania dongpingensis]|uniref:Uncharacterized protein n=1 Tax=Qiania dongpingensis TaxID=2763669 RepID=A0A7G9G655_9FIRM|nr:hypothetical protein [Qiania dongpingensis]QNM06287.1 hypothetical protein H9Q78_03855 [Qiania dongpingensis]